MDTSTKNVFGQPRLRASLRDLRSPRKNYKSTIEDDLKKLIIMDNLAPEQERDAGVRRGRLRHTHTVRIRRARWLWEGKGGGQSSLRSLWPLLPVASICGTCQPHLGVCSFIARSQVVTLVRDQITA